MKRFLLAFVAFFLSFSSFAQVTINGFTGTDGEKVVSDSWSPDGFFGSIANTPSFTYSNYTVLGKEHDLDCSAEGIVTVSFDMTSGVKYALHIMGVDLLDAEGNVISSDYHYGTAGAANNCNEYSLHVTTDAVKIRYFVENYAPIDTYGEISFVWRGVQLGKSHSWSPERWIAVRNIPAEVANINGNFIVPYVRKMETLIELEKGVHLIEFKYSGTTGELRLGGVEVVDSEGNVVCGDYHHASARVNPESAVYSVKVLQNGTYTLRYYCENKSTLNNTEGIVEIHTAEPINISEDGKTGWTHLTKTGKDLSLPFTVVNASCIPDAVLGLDGVESANVRVCERLITVKSLSSVDVEFQITGGSKAIRFAGVEFIKVSDSDDDDADASHYKKMLEDASASSVSRYILAPVEGDYLMRAYAYVENSNIIDSKGYIEFHVDETIIDASVEGLSELTTVDNWDPSSFVKASDVPESISQVSSSNVRIMTALVKLYDVDAKLTVDFEIKSGQRALDVAGVDIVDAFGNVLAKDYHFSSFGGNPGEPYCLSLSSRNFKIGETYLIRFFNGQNNPSSSTRDIDSEGNVKFCVQKKTFEASTLDVSRYYYYIKGENGQYISAKSGNATLVDDKENASKFYFKENDAVYNLISFEAGLYMDLSGSNLATAVVDSKTDLALGKGFGSGKSVLIKAGDNYLTNGLGVTTDIDDNISWTLEEVESLNFSISDARYSTLCVPVEVQIPDGVKAYTFGGLNITDGVGVLNLEKVTTDYLPAYEAVLLFSVNPAGGGFEFALTGGDNKKNNDDGFKGTIVNHKFDQEDGRIFMYLTKVGDNVGFYKRKTMPYTLGANKAYFYLTSEQQAAVSRGMSMRLIDGTTGIEDVTVDAVVEDTIYDLQGRRLDEVTAPGIYIVNGKKMYIK